MNFLSGFKKVTHFVAVGFAAAVAFAETPAGKALINQYPKLSGAAAIIALIGSLYHSPQKE